MSIRDRTIGGNTHPVIEVDYPDATFFLVAVESRLKTCFASFSILKAIFKQMLR
jgi:hypothetical protein